MNMQTCSSSNGHSLAIGCIHTACLRMATLSACEPSVILTLLTGPFERFEQKNARFTPANKMHIHRCLVDQRTSARAIPRTPACAPACSHACPPACQNARLHGPYVIHMFISARSPQEQRASLLGARTLLVGFQLSHGQRTSRTTVRSTGSWANALPSSLLLGE